MTRETVLIVEDDRDIREALTEILEEEGYGVLRAADGRRALAILGAESSLPALVIADLAMPTMSGEELIDAMRASPTLRSIPIIVSSAMPDVVERAEMLGASAVVRKPFELAKLLSLVERWCAERDHVEVEDSHADSAGEEF